MNFFSPWDFLWLAPLTAGIVALWMLRRKRTPVTVSSLYLWQSVLRDTQTNTPFQKLRRNLLLFLQLLIAFLLIFALARPFVFGRGLTGRALVVIIDTSASMEATDVHPSRLEAAKAAAERYLGQEMSGSDMAMVIAAGIRPQAIIGFTTDRARLDDAIEKIVGSDAPGDLAAALIVAQSLAEGRSGSQIRVFSDGVIGPGAVRRLAALSFGAADVRQQTVGISSAENAAITALHGLRDPMTGRMEIYVAVRSYGPRTPGGTLSLLQDGRLIDARALALSGGFQTETFDDPLLQRGGLVTARIDVQDDLAVDNEASIVLPPPRKQRILLVSRGNLFLERGLNLDADVTLDECAPDKFTSEGRGGRGYDLVVFDSTLPAALPPCSALFFGAAGRQTPLVRAGGTTTAPAFVDEDRSRPVMQFVDLTGLQIREMPKMAAQPWATTLAEGTGGPWIAAGEHNGRRMVSVAFSLSESNWPLRVSFPIFLQNAASWLTAPSRLGGEDQETDTGQPMTIIVPPGLSDLAISRPGGGVGAVSCPANGGPVKYDDTRRAGIYHAHAAGGIDYPLAVDLLDPPESDITPKHLPQLSHPVAPPAVADIPLAKRARNDLWMDVAAVALALVVLEWLAYHRRIG